MNHVRNSGHEFPKQVLWLIKQLLLRIGLNATLLCSRPIS